MMLSALHNVRAMPARRFGGAAIIISIVAVFAGCSIDMGADEEELFFGLALLELDGVARDLTDSGKRLGDLAAGDVLEIEVSGDGIDAVLILAEDDLIGGAGVVVGGGSANAPFQYLIPHSGRARRTWFPAYCPSGREPPHRRHRRRPTWP